MEDNYCPECDGYLEDDNYQWCDHCSAYVGIVSNQTAETTVTIECLNCGTRNDILNENCTNCGESPSNYALRCNPDNHSIEGLEVKCPNCGVYNSNWSKKCHNCG